MSRKGSHLVLGGNVHDAVGVNVEGDLDLRDTAGCRGDADLQVTGQRDGKRGGRAVIVREAQSSSSFAMRSAAWTSHHGLSWTHRVEADGKEEQQEGEFFDTPPPSQASNVRSPGQSFRASCCLLPSRAHPGAP